MKQRNDFTTIMNNINKQLVKVLFYFVRIINTITIYIYIYILE